MSLRYCSLQSFCDYRINVSLVRETDDCVFLTCQQEMWLTNANVNSSYLHLISKCTKSDNVYDQWIGSQLFFPIEIYSIKLIFRFQSTHREYEAVKLLFLPMHMGYLLKRTTQNVIKWNMAVTWKTKRTQKKPHNKRSGIENSAQQFWRDANLHGSFAVEKFDLLRFYHTKIKLMTFSDPPFKPIDAILR